MKSSGRWVLIGCLSALYLAAIGGVAWGVSSVVRATKRVQIARHEIVAPLPKGRMFTRVETNAFLDAARRAEDIADPLQRCLAYPDPPGSHWDHDAVVAYCRFRFQPIISLADIKRMVQAGRARELDRMFDDALHAQMTDPDARGRLDRIFSVDFEKPAFDTRSILDAWKRQSPDSAYAYAASGYEYEQMAFAARGHDYISKTPQSSLDAMDRLAAQADVDLRRALALNPKITPAYGAMISLGAMSFGEHYALGAVRRGLAQDPGNFALYGGWMWVEQPNWYGSLDAMGAVAADAQKHVDRNPLLRQLASSRDFYRIQWCKCAPDVQLSAYMAMLDKPAGEKMLNDAALAAKDAGKPQARAIYFSEALRFNPELRDSRLARIYDLVEFDRIHWAVEEASRLIAASPDDELPVKARAWAYLVGNDLPHARQDFETAARLDPSDGWVQVQLAGLYMGEKQWGRAWDIANRMIARTPQDMAGWSVRAQIQLLEPRPGLKETTDYLESHFYSDKKNLKFNAYIAHLRTVVRQRAKANNGKAPRLIGAD
ncbi:MAG TPA: DUF4034 domain-containing protein [Rhodanobacteraceae bacterium]